MAMTSVRIDSVAVAQMFRGPMGMVMTDVSRRAEMVQTLAKVQVGYDESKASGEAGGAHLRDTIVKRFVMGSFGPEVQVGSDHPIALLHHEGTPPHEIVPKTAKVLRFPTSRGGSVFVYATRVSHPGTKPNRYLSDSVKRVGLIFRPR